jgi:peptidoglycan/xylan/chitin deacetylase (PgdA/CDA1 family)
VLKVLLTVDTELWPSSPQWPERSMPAQRPTIDQDYENCIMGKTKSGNYGLPYILDTLNQHGLKAVFFVESLCASALGGSHLEKTVSMIQGQNQEVQLHVHTEWLSELDTPGLPTAHRQNLGDFSRAEQTSIVRQARENLLSAGASQLLALRAGNMGGNRDTPFAARAAGLTLDMSFDLAQSPEARSTVKEVNTLEPESGACPVVPLSCVEDYPGHYRPAQVTALSFAELREALLIAERDASPYFVLLLHSFELVTRDPGVPMRPHRINIARFNNLCRFLADHRDRFSTVGCAEVSSRSTAVRTSCIPRTSALSMLWRVGEQLVSRAL